MSVTINGTNGLVFNDASTQNTAATGFGFKNRIINGSMMIDQRNAGASVSNINGFSADRWYVMRGNASSNPVFNAQQSTIVPAGFKNSLAITVGTSGAPGTTNYSTLYQRIEGYNCSDLGFGAAGASTVTLSFWVNCSVIGTYGVAFQNDSTNRSYIATYTVNSANTWEYKTITIAGDTSGTWLTSNATGLSIYWDIGVGTTQSTTAGSWQAGNYLGLTGGTKLSNTSGATFYITGVQLEKGSTATSFDYRPYGTELALCQRYFCKSYSTGTAVGSNTGDGPFLNTGTNSNGYGPFFNWSFPTTMRASPTVTPYAPDGTSGALRSSGTNKTAGAFGGGRLSAQCTVFCIFGTYVQYAEAEGHVIASAEL